MASDRRTPGVAARSGWLRCALFAAGVYALSLLGYYAALHEPKAIELRMRERTLRTLQERAAEVQAAEKHWEEFQPELERLLHELGMLDPILPPELDGAEELRRLESVVERLGHELREEEVGEVRTRELFVELPISFLVTVEDLDTLSALVERLELTNPLRIVTAIRLHRSGGRLTDARVTVTIHGAGLAQ